MTASTWRMTISIHNLINSYWLQKYCNQRLWIEMVFEIMKIVGEDEIGDWSCLSITSQYLSIAAFQSINDHHAAHSSARTRMARCSWCRLIAVLGRSPRGPAIGSSCNRRHSCQPFSMLDAILCDWQSHVVWSGSGLHWRLYNRSPSWDRCRSRSRAASSSTNLARYPIYWECWGPIHSTWVGSLLSLSSPQSSIWFSPLAVLWSR